MANPLYTIGYEGAEFADFIATLKYAGIKCIIDIRELPLSRRKGFSKNALSEALGKAGISYVHLKGLGDPKPGREAARRGDMTEFRKIFTRHMSTSEAKEDLKSAIAWATKTPSCLLCFERNNDGCHRTIVANEIAKTTKIQIKHIGVRPDMGRRGDNRLARQSEKQLAFG